MEIIGLSFRISNSLSLTTMSFLMLDEICIYEFFLSLYAKM